MKIGTNEMKLLDDLYRLTDQFFAPGKSVRFINYRYLVRCKANKDVPDYNGMREWQFRARRRQLRKKGGPIPTDISTHTSRAARNLAQKGLVRLRRKSNRIDEIGLTPEGYSLLMLKFEWPYPLRRLINFLGTPADAARELGTSKPTISRWLNGKRHPEDISGTSARVKQLVNKLEKVEVEERRKKYGRKRVGKC